MSNHSPLPWKLDVLHDRILDANDNEILTLHEKAHQWNADTGEETELTLPYAANAKLVVEAVNKACKE